MGTVVKFNIPTEVHTALKAYAAAHDRPITWALRQAVAALTGVPPTASQPATQAEAEEGWIGGSPEAERVFKERMARKHGTAPAPAEPAPPKPPREPAPTTPQPTRPESLSERTDYSTGALAARLRDR